MYLMTITKSKERVINPRIIGYQRERLAVIKLAVNTNILQHIIII
jgi:hypothetical protein